MSRLIFAVVVLTSTVMVHAEDWPQFLGSNRTGISTEANLIDEFPVAGPKVAWRSQLGVGMSNLAVADSVVYTLYQDDESQYLAALNAEDGKLVWKTAVAGSYRNGMGNGPRATPTISGDTAYVFTGDGILSAVDLQNQKLKWRVDTPTHLATKPADYGMASSPLLVDGVVVVHVGSPNGSVAGYDAKSGEQLWRSGHGPAGYSSPALLSPGGTQQIVSFTGNSVIGIAPKDGNRLWSFPFETDYHCNTASPVQLSEDSLLISSGENHGAMVLKLQNTSGEWSAKSVRTSFGKESVLRAEWQTPVVFEDHIFGLDNVGSAGPITNLVCIDSKTFEQVWIEKRFGKSNFTLADGKLFFTTMRGELVIVKANSEKFEELGRHVVLKGMTRQAPAISGGHLYIRDDSEVVCVDIRKPSSGE